MGGYGMLKNKKPTYKEFIQEQLRRDKLALKNLKVDLEVYRASNIKHQEVLEERIELQEKQLIV